ncbi:hypothetical protein U1Q18_042396 [Sarracenia purpurea var. burkii]
MDKFVIAAMIHINVESNGTRDAHSCIISVSKERFCPNRRDPFAVQLVHRSSSRRSSRRPDVLKIDDNKQRVFEFKYVSYNEFPKAPRVLKINHQVTKPINDTRTSTDRSRSSTTTDRKTPGIPKRKARVLKPDTARSYFSHQSTTAPTLPVNPNREGAETTNVDRHVGFDLKEHSRFRNP